MAHRRVRLPPDPGERRVREREVLLHEIERETDAQGVVWDCFLQALWSEEDPLARPVYGTPEAVMAITADDLYAHFVRYLAPTRMVLAVAGGGGARGGVGGRAVAGHPGPWPVGPGQGPPGDLPGGRRGGRRVKRSAPAGGQGHGHPTGEGRALPAPPAPAGGAGRGLSSHERGPGLPGAGLPGR